MATGSRPPCACHIALTQPIGPQRLKIASIQLQLQRADRRAGSARQGDQAAELQMWVHYSAPRSATTVVTPQQRMQGEFARVQLDAVSINRNDILSPNGQIACLFGVPLWRPSRLNRATDALLELFQVVSEER